MGEDGNVLVDGVVLLVVVGRMGRRWRVTMVRTNKKEP
jgi:hypothetical protein